MTRAPPSLRAKLASSTERQESPGGGINGGSSNGASHGNGSGMGMGMDGMSNDRGERQWVGSGGDQGSLESKQQHENESRDRERGRGSSEIPTLRGKGQGQGQSVGQSQGQNPLTATTVTTSKNHIVSVPTVQGVVGVDASEGSRVSPSAMTSHNHHSHNNHNHNNSVHSSPEYGGVGGRAALQQQPQQQQQGTHFSPSNNSSGGGGGGMTPGGITEMVGRMDRYSPPPPSPPNHHLYPSPPFPTFLLTLFTHFEFSFFYFPLSTLFPPNPLPPPHIPPLLSPPLQCQTPDRSACHEKPHFSTPSTTPTRTGLRARSRAGIGTVRKSRSPQQQLPQQQHPLPWEWCFPFECSGVISSYSLRLFTILCRT